MLAPLRVRALPRRSALRCPGGAPAGDGAPGAPDASSPAAPAPVEPQRRAGADWAGDHDLEQRAGPSSCPSRAGPGPRAGCAPPEGSTTAASRPPSALDTVAAAAEGRRRGSGRRRHLRPGVAAAVAATGAVVVPRPRPRGRSRRRGPRRRPTQPPPSAGWAPARGGLLGDVPSATAGDVTTALTAATPYDAAVVPDADGVGTVLLTARDAGALRPRFGGASAHAHEQEGAVRLELDLPRLRRDVDDEARCAGRSASASAAHGGAARAPRHPGRRPRRPAHGLTGLTALGWARAGERPHLRRGDRGGQRPARRRARGAFSPAEVFERSALLRRGPDSGSASRSATAALTRCCPVPRIGPGETIR